MLFRAFALIILLTIFEKSYQLYTIPEPEVIVYKPRGFSVNIPHTPGVEAFAFHGNINKYLPDLHAGDLYGDVRNPENGKWTFQDTRHMLKIGDVIYYWLFVIKDGLAYRLDRGEFQVKEYSDHMLPAIPTGIPRTSISNERTSMCFETILNLTQTLVLQKTQISHLEFRNQQKKRYMEQQVDAKTLTIIGELPQNDPPSSTVRFILKEKLDLNPTIVAAKINPDGSIMFKVASIEDRLDILDAAKTKLINKRIVIE